MSQQDLHFMWREEGESICILQEDYRENTAAGKTTVSQISDVFQSTDVLGAATASP